MSHELALMRRFVERVVWVAEGTVQAVAPETLAEDEALGRLFVGEPT